MAFLRPTESNSLYQQIAGRGLRLNPDKTDKKPSRDWVPVTVPCPDCGFENSFWGVMSLDGEVIEHFGRKCRGANQDQATMQIEACGYRFRSKLCHVCASENDVTARSCWKCQAVLVDADAKLKQAKLSKNAHVLTPEKITFEQRLDKNSNPYLEVRYYDADAKYLLEAHFFYSSSSLKGFQINFLRSHLKRPELSGEIQNPDEVIKYQTLLRLPSFVIARKTPPKIIF